MHVPDGFIDGPTSLAAGAAAGAVVAVALRRASDSLDERAVPLAGLTAAYIFAMQMLNFPVAAGTSGHMLGGVLAAVLVGPWVAMLCMTVVLVVQALVFADGGLSAIGINVLVMGATTSFAGYGVFVAVRRTLPDTARSVVAASVAAAWCSVVIASLVFAGFFAIGGTADVSLGAVITAMTGVHVLVGLGEAAITGLTISAVLNLRPDLVHGATAMRPDRSVPVFVGGAS